MRSAARALLGGILLCLGAMVGCGGRTGLGVWHDGGGLDTVVLDGFVQDGAADSGDAVSRDAALGDRGRREDAFLGKNCAQIMLCVFNSLQGGIDWQQVLSCTEGSTVDGLSQATSVVACLARNCGLLLLGDGGGQFEILLCLLEYCHTELCACEGIEALVPPGLLVCP